MAYQSLYRKYRPQTFADVVGQGHVVRTLQNALTSGRVAHGYLFTGTRGTAKTTVARLLAKALNCESSDHPTAEPCNVCNACLTITAGSAVDVIEMDAASHRGVSDIEEVRRAVGYGPMQLRYKVFIIDEAHQLSSDAKDAFLKTLEEPPANVVFILATTEPQAIPITIRSRCQQFDFKRGSMGEITGRLRYVLECEGVSYTPDAVSLVARGAEGSYRDSLSLLEQVLAFSPTQVTAPDVEAVLGSLDKEMLGKVVDAVSRCDAPESFALAGQILDAGKEARTLLRTLSLHFRDLLLVQVGGAAVASEMTPDEVKRLQVEARLFTPEQMMRAMDILNEAQGETRWNNQHRLLTELTFLKLMRLGAGQGENKAFLTAPIVFAEGASVPVSGAALVSVVPVAKPVALASPLSPNPSPPAGGEKGEIEGTGAESLDIPASPTTTPPTNSPFSPPAGGEGRGERGAGATDAAYFAADPVPDDEADDETMSYVVDEGFAPVGDEDAPADDSLPFPVAKVVAPEPVADDLPASVEPEEWKLFDDAPQPGPGLFDTAPVAVSVPESPSRPPSVAERLREESPPFPPRERTAHPPALSLKNVEETVAPAQTVRAVAEPLTAGVVSSTSDGGEPDAGEPAVTLGQVKAAWGQFLRRTEQFSRMTFMYLQQAEPTQIAGGRTVVLMIKYRPYYEMLMDKPKAQAFIKKVLSQVLGRATIGLRLELDPSQVVPPKRLRVAESDKVRRYDRLAALDAEAGDPMPTYPAPKTPAPQSGASFGWSEGRAEAARPVLQATAAPVFADAAPVPRPAPVVAPITPSGRREIALAEPLVQEILQHFGGDIVLD